MKNILLVTLLFVTRLAMAQHTFTAVVQDSASKETLPGVSIILLNTTIAGSTDTSGKIVLRNIPPGKQTLRLSFVGYHTKIVSLNFPLADESKRYLILLELEANPRSLEEVIISSTRTNSRIEDLPVKVEVIGQEEMQEEGQMKPGNVASLLSDMSVIHVQQTSSTTGNTAIRMQGLEGKYTQLLRDGLPLYEGFSGNFGVLSIPPLDLKQIEIIKGSVSTLYGGGAIAGLINFISKKPTGERDLSFSINRSTLNETNMNGYFGQRKGKFGLTLLVQQNLQDAADVNKDDFSDVAQVKGTIFHPRFFYYINPKSTLDLGYSYSHENRIGGDMQVIDKRPDANHTYFKSNLSDRNTTDFHYQFIADSTNQFNFKGSLSNYRQLGSEQDFKLKANQLSNYFEAANLLKKGRHDVVLGANYIGEYFRKLRSDPTAINNYTYHTLGTFAQDGWHISDKFLIESGLRADHHSRYGWFILPRIAFLYQVQKNLSMRLSSGAGYKTPNLFNSETLSGSLKSLQPVDQRISSERSWGINFDTSYRILTEDGSINIDQAFYYSNINNPISTVKAANGTISLLNTNGRVHSAGTDTYLRMRFDELEIYFGYNHTIAQQKSQAKKYYLPFSPQNKFSSILGYEIEGKWRFGIDNSYVASQYNERQEKVRNYYFVAAVIEKKFGTKFSIVLNGENLTDFRQSKSEVLYTGIRIDPQFNSLWGPIDGRVINMALKLKL
ncbi:MAG: TonB-dependent receptor [Daejeonella sp.]